MTVYFAYYLLVAFVSIVIPRCCADVQKCKRNIAVVVFLGMFAFLAFRHPSMGIDLYYGQSYGYIGRFHYIGTMNIVEAFTTSVNNYERGYIVFNKLLSYISKNEQFLLGACAFCSVLPVVYAIYKLSDTPSLSIYIYMALPVFVVLFSALRQALAVGICCMALIYIDERKPVKFIIAVLLASTFHVTALVFLIAYPIYQIRISREIRVLTLCILPLLYVFRNQLFVVLSRLIKENAVPDNNGAITLFVVFCLIYVFGILYTDEGKEENGMLNIFFMACCCQAFGGVYSTAIRVGYYFMYPLMFFLPRMLKRNTTYRDSVILTLVIGLCFVLFGLYSIRTTYWSMSYPYRWFWQ